jgi:hypothetical protein
MATLIVTSQLLSLHYGRLKDAGRLTPPQVGVALGAEVACSQGRLLGVLGRWSSAVLSCFEDAPIMHRHRPYLGAIVDSVGRCLHVVVQ